MNRRNARFVGRDEGRLFQSGSPVAREAYIAEGKQRVAHTYGTSVATLHEYQMGWDEAWIAPEAPNVPKAHNPNTRFCDCLACMA